MKVIENNNTSFFDCDNTLVLYKDIYTKADGKIEFSYGDTPIYLTPHKMHVMFLKHCKNRGDLVVLWSKNGFSWAQEIAKKLGIENYVDYCMSKPTRHIDDKETLNEIVGDRVFLGDE